MPIHIIGLKAQQELLRPLRLRPRCRRPRRGGHSSRFFVERPLLGRLDFNHSHMSVSRTGPVCSPETRCAVREHSRTLTQARIESVVEPVSEKIEAKHGKKDCETWEHRHPPSALKVALRVPEHVPPRDEVRVTKPEEP